MKKTEKMVAIYTDENGNKRTMVKDYETKTAFVKDLRGNGFKTSGAVFTESEVEGIKTEGLVGWEKLSATLRSVGLEFVTQCVIDYFGQVADSYNKESNKYEIGGRLMAYAEALNFLKTEKALSHKEAVNQLKALKEAA